MNHSVLFSFSYIFDVSPSLYKLEKSSRVYANIPAARAHARGQNICFFLSRVRSITSLAFFSLSIYIYIISRSGVSIFIFSDSRSSDRIAIIRSGSSWVCSSRRLVAEIAGLSLLPRASACSRDNKTRREFSRPFATKKEILESPLVCTRNDKSDYA